MKPTKDTLLQMIRDGHDMTRQDMLRLTFFLSAPAMLAQLSDIIMQYIDASMVGSLGAEASASIGIVSTSIWLMGGLCGAAAVGFSVQVAHAIGAKDFEGARSVVRQSILACLIWGCVLAAIGCSISPYLPVWLGGNESIHHDASLYFCTFALMLPVLLLGRMAGAVLRCSGEMRIPSYINVMACVLDVLFNMVFIFKMHMGVFGAALGTAAAQLASCILMTYFLFIKNKELNLLDHKGSYRLKKITMLKGLKIGGPIGIEHLIMCGAQIMSTIIVAPLGTIAIAANSFGITIESLCYMPGYGISEAATTLVGQSLGAKRRELAHRFGWITITMGIAIMSFMGVIMYIFAPDLMSIMSPDINVQRLASEVLRIEAFAEPMFAASIVAYGVFVGAGDTIIPCTMNLASIWAVRITLAWSLASKYGLHGVWFAMAIELCFRGMIFLWRMKSNKWNKIKQQ
ncbi:MAG: MATE family efflux transporter [Bacteroidaceae bacterium]|nr:MATE family efflux transporter [Bacteroidaceae bacterium]